MCTACQLAKQFLNENTLQILVVLMDCIDMQHVRVHKACVHHRMDCELTAGQVGTGSAWKLYICFAAATLCLWYQSCSGLAAG